MKSGGRWIVLLVAAVCAGGTLRAAAPVDALPGVDEKWRHFRSPNFEVYSSARDEKEARGFLWNLELLRAVFFERFRLSERSRLDLTAYHFRKLDHFLAYAPAGMTPENRVSAFYQPFPDRAIISIAPTESREQAQQIILHEYVHHLFRATDQHPMLWFNEGVAELLETLRIEKGKIEMGHGAPGTLYLLQSQKLLPLETIFAADPSSPIYRAHAERGMFYAESWALLHYLHFGQTDLPRDGVNRFVRVVGDAQAAARADLPALFRECLGMDFAQMQQRLDRYVVNGKYRVGLHPVPAIAAASTYLAREVPPAEMRLRLAELALRVRQAAAARLALLDAAAADTPDPRIHEVLGAAALIFDRDARDAAEHWEKALALGSTNVAIERELGLMEIRQWLRKFDYDLRLPAEVATRLRGRLRRSIAAAPTQSAAYEMLALVEAFSPEPSIENVNLVQEHFPQLKEKQRTVIALALVRARLEKVDEAKKLLSELAQLPPPEPAVARIAEIVRQRLEGATPTGRATSPAP